MARGADDVCGRRVNGDRPGHVATLRGATGHGQPLDKLGRDLPGNTGFLERAFHRRLCRGQIDARTLLDYVERGGVGLQARSLQHTRRNSLVIQPEAGTATHIPRQIVMKPLVRRLADRHDNVLRASAKGHAGDDRVQGVEPGPVACGNRLDKLTVGDDVPQGRDQANKVFSLGVDRLVGPAAREPDIPAQRGAIDLLTGEVPAIPLKPGLAQIADGTCNADLVARQHGNRLSAVGGRVGRLCVFVLLLGAAQRRHDRVQLGVGVVEFFLIGEFPRNLALEFRDPGLAAVLGAPGLLDAAVDAFGGGLFRDFLEIGAELRGRDQVVVLVVIGGEGFLPVEDHDQLALRAAVPKARSSDNLKREAIDGCSTERLLAQIGLLGAGLVPLRCQCLCGLVDVDMLLPRNGRLETRRAKRVPHQFVCVVLGRDIQTGNLELPALLGALLLGVDAFLNGDGGIAQG